MKYNVGEIVSMVFDTAPNITGLTDMRMSGVDLLTDTDMTLAGGLLVDPNTARAFLATESAVSPGTYVFKTSTLPAGEYLLWMSSLLNGATSNKVKVSVVASASGDPFYGQAQA